MAKDPLYQRKTYWFWKGTWMTLFKPGQTFTITLQSFLITYPKFRQFPIAISHSPSAAGKGLKNLGHIGYQIETKLRFIILNSNQHQGPEVVF